MAKAIYLQNKSENPDVLIKQTDAGFVQVQTTEGATAIKAIQGRAAGAYESTEKDFTAALNAAAKTLGLDVKAAKK